MKKGMYMSSGWRKPKKKVSEAAQVTHFFFCRITCHDESLTIINYSIKNAGMF